MDHRRAIDANLKWFYPEGSETQIEAIKAFPKGSVDHLWAIEACTGGANVLFKRFGSSSMGAEGPF